MYGLIGALLLLLIVGHFVLKNHYDPMKKIEAMNDAYHKQDAETFYKQFHVEKEVVGDPVSFFALINVESDDCPHCVKRLMDRVAYDGGYLAIQKKPILFGGKEVTSQV